MPLTSAALTVALTHSLVKLRPGTTPPPFSGLSIARNEYESFQVVVTAGAQPVTVHGVSTTFPAGSGMSSLVHGVRYINISTQSDCNGDVGEWPDALVPLRDPFVSEPRGHFPIVIPPGNRKVFWVDVFAAPDAGTGCHSVGVVVDTGAEDNPVGASLTVTVRGFGLPSTSTRYATTYGFSEQSAWNAAGATTTEEQANVTRRYLDLGLMHRVTLNPFAGATSDALAAEPPDWASFDAAWGAYVKPTSSAGNNGGVDTPFGLVGARLTSVQLPPQHYTYRSPPDNAAIDALWHATGCAAKTPSWGYAYWGSQADCGANDMYTYCEHLANHENDPWSRTCGSLVNATRGCIKQPASACPPGKTPPNNTAAYAFWKSAYAHASGQGWSDLLFDYTCDEPGTNQERITACKLRGGDLHRAEPRLRSLITMAREDADAANMTSQINVWVPIINYIDNDPAICTGYPPWADGNTRPVYDDLVAQGDDLWWYQSCMSEGCASAKPPPGEGCKSKSSPCYNGTWPSYMIDAPATFNRVMSWMSYAYDMRGELYWGTNAADRNATQAWEDQWIAGGNGDGTLTYSGLPSMIGGSTVVPIASQRLKLIRDGLEDLEYMYAAEARVGRDRVLAEVHRVVASTHKWEHDAAAYWEARERIAALAEPPTTV
eukprot:m.46339 g.46339  ORF g.46339 m.46339 type:complete len:659 (+) comp6748_c0_seq1:59-2035(+)